MKIGAGPLWVRLAVTTGILVYLAREIDVQAASLAIVQVDAAWLLAVLALVACDRGVMILRWVLLLRASQVAVSTSEAARIFLVSSFVGSFLPAGIGGDAARAYGLTRATTEANEALASVAVDRVLGILSLLAMGAVGLMLTAATLGDWRVAVAVALLASASAALFWADCLARTLLPARWQATRLGERVAGLAAALSRYRRRPAALVHVFVWSLIVQLLRIVQAYFLGSGLGLAVPFRHYLVFMPVGLLMLLLPVSVSGFGLPQGVIVWLMRPLGTPDEQSFALSTLIVLTGLAGNLPGLLLWMRASKDARGHAQPSRTP